MTHATDHVARSSAFALAVAFSIALAQPAAAQSGPASARADALFAQGKAALEAGDYAHACPKLQESYGIDPSNGTLLALAVCHEGLGRTATAWREFRTAADGATKEGRADRAEFAQSHISKLEPRLSKLTVVVPADAPGGLDVDVDGAPLAQGEWGKPSPIDPGHHALSAHAAGKKPWTASVDIGPEHDAQTIKVGPLVADASPAPAVDAAPAPVPPPPPTDASSNDSTASADSSAPGAWKRPAGWIVGGAGLAALAVGGYFGVSAISKSSDAKSQCSPSPSSCPSGALSENNDAKTAATVSDIAIGVGLAAVAVGAYFLFTAPSPSSSGLNIAPYVTGRQAGVAFEQAW